MGELVNPRVGVGGFGQGCGGREERREQWVGRGPREPTGHGRPRPRGWNRAWRAPRSRCQASPLALNARPSPPQQRARAAELCSCCAAQAPDPPALDLARAPGGPRGRLLLPGGAGVTREVGTHSVWLWFAGSHVFFISSRLA